MYILIDHILVGHRYALTVAEYRLLPEYQRSLYKQIA